MAHLWEKVARAWKRSSLWNEALDSYAEDEFLTALNLIMDIEKVSELRSREKILKGLVYHQLQQPQKAIELLVDGFESVDSEKKLNPDERRYLKCFVSRYLRHIGAMHKIETQELMVRNTGCNFDKSNVRDTYLWAFPIDLL